MSLPTEKPPFGKIPALRFSLFFLAGILISHWLHSPFILLLIGLLVFLCVSLAAKKVGHGLLILTIVIGGMLTYEARRPSSSRITGFLNRWVGVDGVVCSEPQKTGEKAKFELKMEKLYCNGVTHELSGKILVRFSATNLCYGDRIRVSGILLSPLPKKNPGEFDYKAYLERQGICAILNTNRTGSITLLSSDNGNLFVREIILPLRQFIRKSYSKTLCGESLAFVEGITLGAKEGLSASTRSLFTKTGIYHILAVSGLHVGIVGFIVFTLLGIVRVPRRWITPIVIGILIVYMFVTNLRPSVVRATIMTGMLLLGLSTERNINLLNLLGTALLIILLVDPLSPLDLSFQLSFAATLSIILAVDRFRIKKSTFLRKWLYLPILISLAAQAGTGPIIAYHFFRLPLLPTIANILVIPSVTFSVALGFISSVSTLVSLELARMFAGANWLVIQFILKIAETFGSFKYADVVTGRPSVHLLLAYLLIFGLVLNLRKIWVRKTLIFTVFVLANLFVWQKAFASTPLRATFLSVRGRSCIVQTPGDKTILVDCGGRTNSAERVVAPALWEKGITQIDLLILTGHESPEGLQFLFRNFKIKRLVAAPVPCESKGYIRALELSKEHNSDWFGVMAGDAIVLNGVKLMFYYPTPDIVEFASVFDLNYRGFDLLWWGKGVHGQSKLNLHKKYDVVKFSSGVYSEVGADFVICENPRNAPGHFIDNLLFTKDGAVTVASNGDTFWVEQVSHR